MPVCGVQLRRVFVRSFPVPRHPDVSLPAASVYPGTAGRRSLGRRHSVLRGGQSSDESQSMDMLAVRGVDGRVTADGVELIQRV